MIARSKVLLAAALLIGTASACSDLTGNNVTAEGAFTLQTVSNSSGTTLVPYQYVDNRGHTIFVQSDTYVLSSNGAYTEQQVYQDNGFQQVANESGSWTQSNTAVFFTPQTSDFSISPYQGTVQHNSQFNGNTRALTISINGTTAVYSD
ncbi:MAG: hypothetical protein ABI408_01435 [Gemmatimonadaceae bacterium]